MPESLLLDIDLGDLISDIARLKDETAKLAAENERLRKTTAADTAELEKNNKQVVQNELQIRALNKEKAALIKTVETSNRILKAEEGSIESNRAKLSQLTAEYIKLAKPTEEQTARLLELTNTLKAQEKAYGDTRRNVGNYTESIKDAFGNTRIFGVNIGKTINDLGKMRAGMTAAAGGTKGLTGGFKVLRVALAGLGIGLLIAALKFLFDIFSKINPIVQIFEKTVSAVSDTIEVVVAGITRFVGGLLGMGEQMDANARRAKALKNAMDALATAQRTQIVLDAAAAKEVVKLNVALKDKTKTDQERLKIIEEINAIEKENLEQQIEVAQQALLVSNDKLKAAERERKSEEDIQKLTDDRVQAFVTLTNLEAQQVQQREDAAKRLTDLQKETSDRDKKIADERLKATEKQSAEEKKAADKDKKVREVALSQLLSISRQSNEVELLGLKESLAEGEISRREYNKRVLEIKQQELEQQIEILELFGQDVTDKQIELDNLVVDNKIAGRERDLEHQAEIVARKIELEKSLLEAEQEIEDARISTAQGAFDLLSELATEGSALQKAAFLGAQGAAVAETIINTQRTIAAIAEETALQAASAAILPFPTNIAAAAAITTKGVIKKVLAATQGAIAVAKIAGTTLKQFAEGGEVHDVGGLPHTQGGTKYYGQDGNAFEVERGEKIFVLKQNASEAIDKYSNLNQMFGGKPWTHKTRYAAFGGEIGTAMDGGFQTRAASQEVQQQLSLSQLLRNMPQPVVMVSEINRVQNSGAKSVEVSEL